MRNISQTLSWIKLNYDDSSNHNNFGFVAKCDDAFIVFFWVWVISKVKQQLLRGKNQKLYEDGLRRVYIKTNSMTIVDIIDKFYK